MRMCFVSCEKHVGSLYLSATVENLRLNHWVTRVPRAFLRFDYSAVEAPNRSQTIPNDAGTELK